MTRAIVVALFLAGALSQVAPSTSAQAPASRAPRNAEEFEVLFQQVKNWGRWGANDQLGSANLLTAETRKRAIALAKTGESVSLSHNLITDKADDNASPFEHTMLGANNMDKYGVSHHGYAHSHIDGLCHILYKGQTYNGYPTADVNTPAGCVKLGIENLKQGVITRGILIDIPLLRGVPYLEPGYGDLRRGHRGVGEEGGNQDRPRRRHPPADRSLGPPRQGRTLERRAQRRGFSRLDRAVDQGSRRSFRRQRRGAGRGAFDGRRSRPAGAHTAADRHGDQPAGQSGS